MAKTVRLPSCNFMYNVSILVDHVIQYVDMEGRPGLGSSPTDFLTSLKA
jgi:hypothetical protein